MAAEVLAKARVRDAALAQEVRMAGTDTTARQDCRGLEASMHPGATQDGEPENRELLQQSQKPKPKVQLTLQPEPRHEPKPKPKPTPISTRRRETV